MIIKEILLGIIVDIIIILHLNIAMMLVHIDHLEIPIIRENHGKMDLSLINLLMEESWKQELKEVKDVIEIIINEIYIYFSMIFFKKYY
jgi:hypothetical protein